jgi:hypothetical protein
MPPAALAGKALLVARNDSDCNSARYPAENLGVTATRKNDTLRHLPRLCTRKRVGVYVLIIGAASITVSALLSAVLGNQTVFQYASLLFTVCVTFALILLTTPPHGEHRDDGVQ